MANWDKFKVNDSGKVTINRVDKKPEKLLDVIKLSKLNYFVDKEYLRGLTEYSAETLKNTPIYSLVGTDQGSDEKRGITIEIRELKKLNHLEEFINELNQLKEANKLKDIFN
jgi:hypothetical protein